jgi:hypothetical protein
MKAYDEAGSYAKMGLDIDDSLLDYNTLTNFTIPLFNNEVWYHNQSNVGYFYFYQGVAIVDPGLFSQYHQDDLRRQVFFASNGDGTWSFKGSNGITGGLFGGIAKDEMYLNYAEGLARANKLNDAMTWLDKLLVKRYKAGTYVSYQPNSKDDAIKIVLQERRKELLFRGTRWTDLRRLKDESQFAVIPKRTIGNKTYELRPDNPRYTLLIPPEAVNTAELQQNP